MTNSADPDQSASGEEGSVYSLASILYKSTAGRYRPVSYIDGPITARCRFIKNAYWVGFSRTRINITPGLVCYINTMKIKQTNQCLYCSLFKNMSFCRQK